MRKQKTKSKWPARDNSFFACRVSNKLMRAFKAHAKRCKASPASLVVSFMATATGVDP